MTNLFSGDLSPAQLSGAIQTAWGLLGGKTAALAGQWNTTMGRRTRKFNIIYPETIQRMRANGVDDKTLQQVDPYFQYEGDANNFVGGQGVDITGGQSIAKPTKQINGKTYEKESDGKWYPVE